MLKIRRSVRFQLALWYLAVLTAGMAAFGAVSWIFLREVLLENRYRSLDQRLDAVAAFMQNEARGNALSDLREEAREFATGLPPGQGFRVYTQSGELLYEKKSSDAETLERRRYAVIRGHPIDMTLVISMADFHRVLGTLARVMFTVLPLVLLFAMAGGWWLARRALQPVGALTHEARQISARDLSARGGCSRAPIYQIRFAVEEHLDPPRLVPNLQILSTLGRRFVSSPRRDHSSAPDCKMAGRGNHNTSFGP